MSWKLAPGGMVIGAKGTSAYLSLTYLIKEQDEDVVLVLAGIHGRAQFVATGPEGGVKFGFLEGHTLPSEHLNVCTSIYMVGVIEILNGSVSHASTVAYECQANLITR